MAQIVFRNKIFSEIFSISILMFWQTRTMYLCVPIKNTKFCRIIIINLWLWKIKALSWFIHPTSIINIYKPIWEVNIPAWKQADCFEEQGNSGSLLLCHCQFYAQLFLKAIRLQFNSGVQERMANWFTGEKFQKVPISIS